MLVYLGWYEHAPIKSTRKHWPRFMRFLHTGEVSKVSFLRGRFPFPKYLSRFRLAPLHISERGLSCMPSWQTADALAAAPEPRWRPHRVCWPRAPAACVCTRATRTGSPTKRDWPRTLATTLATSRTVVAATGVTKFFSLLLTTAFMESGWWLGTWERCELSAYAACLV